MKISEKYYTEQRNCIEPRYLNLAEELNQQMLECIDWSRDTKEVDAQKVMALWLKVNEQHCKENETDKILDGAKFGDKFKTRDGRMAIFAHRDEVANVCIIEKPESSLAFTEFGECLTDNRASFWAFTDFGRCITDDRELDIVSRWEEER